MSFLAASQTEPVSVKEATMSTTTTTSSSSGASDDNNNNNTLTLSGSGSRSTTPTESPSTVNMVIRQDPFSMTLDANALLAGSLLLLIGMHSLPRPLLESAILAVPLGLLIRNDYQNFLNLGPGGTPPTLAGYARLAWFRLFVLRDPLRPPPPSSVARPARGVLPAQNLPYRPGPRPTVAGLAPQRQLNQHGDADRLRAALVRLAARYPDRFGTATSCLEKHGFALFARHPVNVCGNGEVCHIHSSDGSMHMNLHPDDIAEALRKGWAQRHPMAWGKVPGGGGSGGIGAVHKGEGGWLAGMRVSSPLPETFVLVYAPRDESDLRVVCRIIEAAIWYTVEERVDLESLLVQS